MHEADVHEVFRAMWVGGTYDHIMKKVKFDIFSCTIRVVGDIVVHCYYVHKC